jgi:hypothetical protein
MLQEARWSTSVELLDAALRRQLGSEGGAVPAAFLEALSKVPRDNVFACLLFSGVSRHFRRYGNPLLFWTMFSQAVRGVLVRH